MLSLGTVLQLNGLKLNRDKCVATPAVEFLGHKIDSQGVHKSDKHVQAIRDAPKPSTPEELQLFLGKATYYESFILNLSTKSRTLRDMSQTHPWKWTLAAETAYTDIKNALISPQVLMPYNSQLSLILATDASKTGLGTLFKQRVRTSNRLRKPNNVAY